MFLTFVFFLIFFSSRHTIYSAILYLTKNTVKIQKASTQKYAQDDNWIKKQLKEGKWEQIRDISQKSSPAADAEPETLMSPLRPKRPLEDDLGRGKRMKIPNPKYTNDPTNPENVYVVPTALNFDDLGLEVDDNDDENWELEKKKEPKPKRKKLRLEETILAGERCGLSDYQIAMMYNAGSM